MNNHTDEYRLRPFTIDDSALLISWVPDAGALLQFAGPVFTWPLTRDQLAHYLLDSRRIAYVLLQGNTAIGIGEIYRESPGKVRLCRILIGDTTLRNQGIGLTLTRLLLKQAFAVEGTELVTLNVFDWNESAIRCYKKAGFQRAPGRTVIRETGALSWKVIQMRISRNIYLTQSALKQ
ncbi:MAG: GNAT family N-acetyltransferase [Lentimicrobium sp.]